MKNNNPSAALINAVHICICMMTSHNPILWIQKYNNITLTNMLQVTVRASLPASGLNMHVTKGASGLLDSSFFNKLAESNLFYFLYTI